MKKHRSPRRPHFRPTIIALIFAVLAVAGYFTYRNFFVPQPATIAKITEDIGNDVTFTQTEKEKGGTLTTSDGKKTTVRNTAELTAAKECLLQENKWINGKCVTSAPAPVTGGTTTTTTVVCAGRTSKSCENTAGCFWDGTTCQKDSKTSTPGAPLTDPDVITADAELCPVGNTTAPVGSWVATGEGLKSDGKTVCTSSTPSSDCPFRACVEVETGCKINHAKKAKCGDILASEPTKLVASNAMGCQYFNTRTGQSNTECARPLATCYLGGAYPSGSTKDGKVCNDGEWKEVKDGYDKELCDFVYGTGKTTPQNGQCVVKASTVPLAGKALCDSKGPTYTYTTNGCVLVSSLKKPAGTLVSSPSECASGQASATGNQNTPNAKYVCIGGTTGDIVDNASQCASNYGISQAGGGVKCSTCKDGLNPDDRTNSSYFTCESGKAVFHNCSNGKVITTKNNTTGKTTFSCPPQLQSGINPATPPQPANPTTSFTPPTGSKTYTDPKCGWECKGAEGSFCQAVAGKANTYACSPKSVVPAPPQPIRPTGDIPSGNKCASANNNDSCKSGDCRFFSYPLWGWYCYDPKLKNEDYTNQHPGGTISTPLQPATPDTQPPSDANWNDASSTVQLPDAPSEDVTYKCGNDGWSYQVFTRADKPKYESKLEYCQGNGCTDGKCNSATTNVAINKILNAIRRMFNSL